MRSVCCSLVFDQDDDLFHTKNNPGMSVSYFGMQTASDSS